MTTLGNLRPITNAEADILSELIRRKRQKIDAINKSNGRGRPPKRLEDRSRFLSDLTYALNFQREKVNVGYFGDEDHRFTTAVLRVGEQIRVGAAKRNTYGPSADDYNAERGKEIALSRALEAVEF